MIMEVTPVSPYSTSSQEGQREAFYYQTPRRTSLSFGSMLADEEEKLAVTAAVPRADEFKTAAPQETHYALTEQELEESLAKLLHYAGLDGLE